jgi:hypothetical protein
VLVQSSALRIEAHLLKGLADRSESLRRAVFARERDYGENHVQVTPCTRAIGEDAMRAFYEACGISKATSEAAIKVRREKSVQQDNQKQ